MSVEIVGADPKDTGAKGTVARFLLAAVAEDVEAAEALVAESSREGLDIASVPFKGGRAEIGEEQPREGGGDGVVVPTRLTDQDGAEQEMPFVVREDGGVLRIDFEATFEQMLGIRPEEMMKQMGDALAGMAEGLGEALGAGMQAMGDAMGEAVGAATGSVESAAVADRTWFIPEEAFERFGDGILQTAFAAGAAFAPPFAPPDREHSKEEYEGPDRAMSTIHIGDAEHSFLLVRTAMSGEPPTENRILSASGLPDGQGLSLNATRSGNQRNASVYARAPEPTLDEIGRMLSDRFGVTSIG